MSTTCVALLRGINVGGRNRILMADLAACFKDAGYGGVRTYLQSGIVIFRSDEPDREVLRGSIERMLAQDPVPLVYREIHRVCAQGNFVAVLSEVALDGAPYAQGDLFRVDDDMIVEHWSGAELVAPRADWANSGKF